MTKRCSMIQIENKDWRLEPGQKLKQRLQPSLEFVEQYELYYAETFYKKGMQA